MDPHPRTTRGTHALVGTARRLDVETGELVPERRAIVFPLRCSSWSCFCCAVLLRRRARRRAFKGAALPGRVFMLTLTIDPKDERWRAFRARELRGLRMPGPGPFFEDPAAWGSSLRGTSWDRRWRDAQRRVSVRYVRQAWNKYRTYVNRDAELEELRQGDAVPFHASVELQRNGRAHMHVVLRVPSLAHGFRYRRRLRELAVLAGFGGDVAEGRGRGFDMQAARSRQEMAAYVTKGVGLAAYGTKGGDQVPRYTRRFSWSRSWCEWTPAAPIAGRWEWRVAGGGPAVVTRALEASGFVLVDPARCRVRMAGAMAPPGGVA